MHYREILCGIDACLSQQQDALDRLARLAEMCSLMGQDFRADLAEDDVHAAYSAALEVAVAMQNLMQVPASDRQKASAESEHSDLVSAKYDAHAGAFTVRINITPPLKKRASSTRFLTALCPEVTQKLLAILPKNFVLYDAAHVIYVHHFATDLHATAPYFDNDNVAIKGLLDAIVPFICVDDAAQFCDNHYLSQPDHRTYTELIVIPKNNLLQWATCRPDLDFCKELSAKI